jgi:hypothetical protein
MLLLTLVLSTMTFSNSRTKEALNKSVRGECFPFAPSIHRATRGTGGTTDMTTSHLTNPAKDAGQVIGYSHSTRLPNNSSQVAGYQENGKCIEP